jgi:sugar/nucleoside kinase (ribokinase family)
MKLLKMDIQKNLKIVQDLTGAGDLFAAGFLTWITLNKQPHTRVSKKRYRNVHQE